MGCSGQLIAAILASRYSHNRLRKTDGGRTVEQWRWHPRLYYVSKRTGLLLDQQISTRNLISVDKTFLPWVTVSPFVLKAGSCPRGAASDWLASTAWTPSFRCALNKKIRQTSSSCNLKIKESSSPSNKFWVTGRWSTGKRRCQECRNLAGTE